MCRLSYSELFKSTGQFQFAKLQALTQNKACSAENLTKRSSVLLMRLLRFSAEQTLLELFIHGLPGQNGIGMISLA